MPLAMVTIRNGLKERGCISKLIGQVHDSLVFDSPDKELMYVARYCIKVFEALPALIQQYWGIDFNVPLTGDAEYSAESYGLLKELRLFLKP